MKHQLESCSVCRHPLPCDAPFGLCPSCLFTAALADESSVSELSSPGHGFGNATTVPEWSTGRNPNLAYFVGSEQLGESSAPTTPLADSSGLETVTHSSSPHPQPGLGSSPDPIPSPTPGPSPGLHPSPLIGSSRIGSGGEIPPPVVPGYEILERLGHGGMGVVYKARQIGAERLVALKMIRGDAHLRPDHFERFQLEVQAAARLKHPNVVTVYDVGQVNGRPYFSLELLEGGSLKERLAAAPMAVKPAARVLMRLALALAEAHGAKIIHRDIKPSNVLFDAGGSPRIADFGLAKELGTEDGHTLTGQVVGTPSYMAPEQARGENRIVGPAADIYSLGAVLYEMLTGRPPFKGATTSETIQLVIHQDPVAPSRLQPKVPRDLEKVCLKSLEKDPSRRYATSKELADDLERFLDDKPVLARSTPVWERAAKWVRRNPSIAALVGVAALAVLVAAGGAAWLEQTKRVSEREQLLQEIALGREADDAHLRSYEQRVRGDLGAARETLAPLLGKLHGNPRLEIQLRRVNREIASLKKMQADLEATEHTRKTLDDDLRHFRKARDRALFLDAQVDVFDRDPPSVGAARGPERVRQTREVARAALAVFAGPSRVPTLPSLATREQVAEVTSGTYLMNLVLASALAEPLAGEDIRGQAAEALRVLDGVSTLAASKVAYHFRRAECFDRLADAPAARREREEAERLSPDGEFDLVMIGQENARRGEWEKARASFAAAVRKSPELALARYLTANADLLCRPPRAADAVNHLNYSVSKNPGYAWLYQLRGLAHGLTGAVSAGLAADLARGSDREPASHIADEAAAEFESGEADFREALALGLDDDQRYTLLLNRGMLRFLRHLDEEAAADFRAAIALDGRRYYAYTSLASVLRRLHRPEEAVDQLTKAIELAPAMAVLYRSRAMTRTDRPGYSEDDARAAIRDLRESARLERAGSRAAAVDLARVAELLVQEDPTAADLAAAVEAAETALKSAPDLSEAHHARIDALLRLGRYEEVVAASGEGLKQVRPPTSRLYLFRGLGRAERHDFAGAVDDFTRSLTLQPDSERALNGRGWAFLLSDAPALAVRDFERLVALQPANPEGYSGRAEARVRGGQLRPGLADAEKAIELDPESARTHYRAARVFSTAARLASEDAVRHSRTTSRIAIEFEARAEKELGAVVRLTPAPEREAFCQRALHDDALRPVLRNPRVVERLKTLFPSAP